MSNPVVVRNRLLPSSGRQTLGKGFGRENGLLLHCNVETLDIIKSNTEGSGSTFGGGEVVL